MFWQNDYSAEHKTYNMNCEETIRVIVLTRQRNCTVDFSRIPLLQVTEDFTTDCKDWWLGSPARLRLYIGHYLYLYTIFDQRRLDNIDQVEHGQSPQQVTHLPPVWDLLFPLA